MLRRNTAGVNLNQAQGWNNAIRCELSGRLLAARFRGGGIQSRNSAFNSELLHAAAQRVGMKVEHLGSAALAFDDPGSLLKYGLDVAFLDFFERVGPIAGCNDGAGRDVSNAIGTNSARRQKIRPQFQHRTL